MDSDVRRSEEKSKAEGAQAQGVSAEESSDERWEDTRRVEVIRDRAGYSDRLMAYDPGPSGTAVAGLIIALIALAVGLYAAFAPRETMREGSQAVTTSWEQPVESERPTPQPSPAETPSAAAIRTAVATEIQKEMASVRAELEKLHEDLAKSERTRSAPEK